MDEPRSTEAIDDEVARSIVALMDAGRLTVKTFSIETISAETVHEMQTRHGYASYITENAHTAFKPKPEWIKDGTVKKLKVRACKTHGPHAYVVTFVMSWNYVGYQHLE